jgi:hypothetical protein
MRIGWIGGMLRNEGQLIKMARDAGHELDFHSGDVGGRGAEGLKSLIERSDLVIIMTEMNSHGGMLLAKKLAQRAGRGSLVLRSCGTARFRLLLDALDRRAMANDGGVTTKVA